MEKLCACGCGEPTPIANRTRGHLGYRRGEQIRFLPGHGRRAAAGLAFLLVDRGHTTPCWIWQRNVMGEGYGQLLVSGRKTLAHREYYKRANGPITEGLVLHHECGVRVCVNPDHLTPLTRAAHLELHRQDACA